MRRVTLFVCLALVFSFCQNAAAQEAGKAAPASGGAFAGKWIVSSDFYGTPLYFGMVLEQQGEKLTGKFDGDKLEGSATGKNIHFVAKDENGGTEELDGTLQGDTITGTVVFKSGDNPTNRETHSFAAKLNPAKRGGAPKRHEFTPTPFFQRGFARRKT